MQNANLLLTDDSAHGLDRGLWHTFTVMPYLALHSQPHGILPDQYQQTARS